MSFRLINVCAAFYNLMNDMYKFLDHFVMVYFNDTVIYSDGPR